MKSDEMKTSLEDRAEDSPKGKISFSVDSLLGSRVEAPDAGSNDAESTDAALESDESDVDIEDVESTLGDEGGGEEARGVVVPQPLLPRLYPGHAPPAWPFAGFPWMAPNPMFRTGSPNSKSASDSSTCNPAVSVP
ncbi:unnamed protein product [Plutella xylostella]|uniref:(diamondback moth) hypothetical protein n=1 Tax=Plutella xylostella TaxID=51655 RepID=A0A8S4ETQ8_PLUXY|nr:unnamed protein product [Plutella xylostella]